MNLLCLSGDPVMTLAGSSRVVNPHPDSRSFDDAGKKWTACDVRKTMQNIKTANSSSMFRDVAVCEAQLPPVALKTFQLP